MQFFSHSAEAQPFQPAEAGLSPPILEEIEQSTRAHLEQAQLLISAQQWAEAVETLRRVMETDGDRLIAVPDSADAPFVRYMPVRFYGQSILARWGASAPEALQHYRSELDALGERWLKEARENHDEKLLHDIIDQLFTTSSGDDALLLLGEYAFERGEYHIARGYWERISPALRTSQSAAKLPAGRPLWRTLPVRDDDPRWQAILAQSEVPGVSTSWLAYPDTDLPLADVRARLVMASIFESSFDRAERELALLKRLHPDASGKIGGETGIYADLLQKLLTGARQWRTETPHDWVTFAGDASRSLNASADIDIGGVPLWRVSLPQVDATADVFAGRRLRPAEDNGAWLSYFPVIVNKSVFVALGNRIHGFDLRTGSGLVSNTSRSDPQSLPGLLYEATSPQRVNFDVQQLGVPRFTLTTDGGRLFARVGSPFTRIAFMPDAFDERSAQIAGLDLQAEGRLLPGFPLQPDNSNWTFEGSPLCDGRYIYVALRHQDAVRVESHVASYDSLTGKQLWRRMLCAGETLGQGRLDEITHNLLTLHGSTIFCNTNLGVIAAVSAADGHLRWLVRYPRSAGSIHADHFGESHFFRDLNPVVAHKDIVICAPSDTNRLFALDAFAGQLLWSSEDQASDVVHLLGVGQDHLLASGERLYWFHIHDGQLRGQFPEPYRDAVGHARPQVRGYGRGLLAHDHVYWPTRDAIYVFRQRPIHTEFGWIPVADRAPIDLRLHHARGGNLAVAGNVLLIATPNELIALRCQ